MRLANTLLHWLMTVFLCITLLLPVYAAVEGNVRIDHCTDCGKVLVGAARVDPQTIQWVGSIPSSLTAELSESAFGFNGATAYGANKLLSAEGQWVLDLTTKFAIINSNPLGPSIGFFFAPNRVGAVSDKVSYTATASGQAVRRDIKGEGVLDDDGLSGNDSAVTLDVKLMDAFEGQSCLGGSCTEIASCTQAICDVGVVRGRAVNFLVTPRINQDIVKAKGLDANLNQHVMVNLDVSEQGTLCPNPFSFQEGGISVTNTFARDNFFDYLSPFGPDFIPVCYRVYTFLSKQGNTFEFQANHKADTRNGYVDYRFAVQSHYDFSNPSRWAKSHKTFRLKTSTTTTTVPTTTDTSLAVTITGTGSGNVTSSPAGITCFTGSTGICSGLFKPGVVTLTALPSTGSTVTWGAGCDSSSSSSTGKVTITSGIPATCNIIFTSAPVVSPTKTVKLTVNVSNGGVSGAQVAIPVGSGPGQNCLTQCTAYFSEATTSISLTAQSQVSNASIKWDGDCKSGSSANTAVVSTTGKTADATNTINVSCTATFSQPTPAAPIVTGELLQARFITNTIEKKSDGFLVVELDASNSSGGKTPLTYDWATVNIHGDTSISGIDKLDDKGQKIRFSFKDGTTYAMVLVVTDNNGEKSVTSDIISLPPLFADFTVTQDDRIFIEPSNLGFMVGDSATIVLDASASRAVDGATIAYSWSDNTRIAKQTANFATYRFSSINQYPITLLLTDDKGRSATISKVIRVVKEPEARLDEWELDITATPTLSKGSSVVKGGVLANNQYVSTVNNNIVVDVLANLSVDFKYDQLSAEVLEVLQYMPPGGKDADIRWYMKIDLTKSPDFAKIGNKTPWIFLAQGPNLSNQALANLRARVDEIVLFQTKPLSINLFSGTLGSFSVYDPTNTQPQGVPPYSEKILGVGQYNFYVGYRVKDTGVIVFNVSPIAVKVE